MVESTRWLKCSCFNSVINQLIDSAIWPVNPSWNQLGGWFVVVSAVYHPSQLIFGLVNPCMCKRTLVCVNARWNCIVYPQDVIMRMMYDVWQGAATIGVANYLLFLSSCLLSSWCKRTYRHSFSVLACSLLTVSTLLSYCYYAISSPRLLWVQLDPIYMSIWFRVSFKRKNR